MPLTRPVKTCAVVALVLVAAAVSMMLAAHFDAAFAQTAAPFGAPRGAAAVPAPSGGLAGWIFAKQAEFYRSMSAMIRAAKTDGTAVWTLLGIAFLYGIFHAAGPGHGKAVISSYVVANEETWRRGLVLSFASAMLQAFVAVAIVGIAALLLNATAGQICSAERVIEIASYALIALVGARLIWVKGSGFIRAARGLGQPLHALGAAVTPKHEHEHHAHHHDHAQDHGEHGGHRHAHAAHGHVHGHDHHHHHDDEHASAWGHGHGPEPEELAGPGGWQRGLSAILAVGLRPCSGAILVLVFALAQGLFWAGIAATFVMGLGTAITVGFIATLAVGFRSAAKQFASSRSGYGMLMLRGVEVGAAVVVLAFGVLLLAGYLAAERGACL